MSIEELEFFLDIATEAALAGGAELISYWGNLQNIQEKGSPGNLVTEADKAAEEVIIKVLQRHLPEHGILSEEAGELGSRKSRYLWAIDPLDGTTNFAHQYPFSASSVGLLIDGVPQVGVVFNPILEELFRAAKGLGATRNRKPISVSKTTTLQKSLVITGFAYDRRETTDNNYKEFCQMCHLTQGVRRSGCASYDLSSIACGRADGYWERGLSPWDIAAGIVVLEEAGGKVTAYNSSPFDIKSGKILATNGKIHDLMSKALIETPPLAHWNTEY
ncbi:Inositol-1(or 4)-monophosphatase [Trichodesmium erythraeum IMS101]|uniref:Inositol-1-monophosphatase n=1 Tax=Trichodesmium erythraeum (strain IMS101) TaxID=203124 RepID=Q117Z0_TRIEI|nr:inositol monophosphatase [Trichodesmium erythraeum GBRTRLIN201]MCH2048495.1 inositol monophosphatase [Trichodesmium sp. ALOHA_ZT_67]MCL2927652.1 inositol monophosphatase [Trichodesmium sp. MAG_R01]MDE5090579.1 inositol monophosphatase family protein [Trichodesmium sp. St18_bin3_1_1]MDE5093811.1 inositol monophosphatase family protein [Trichodesmium sp. St11_bin5]MDT9338495.1 inositol monophosphatase [Trichodesmium erythraeum 21-75]